MFFQVAEPNVPTPDPNFVQPTEMEEAVQEIAKEVNQRLPEFMLYKFQGNEIWRFGILLTIIFLTLILARVIRHLIAKTGDRFEKKNETQLLSIIFKSLAPPTSLAIIACGVYFSRFAFVFITEKNPDVGFTASTYNFWIKISQALFAFSVAYFIYRLVDLVEYYLKKWFTGAETGLESMLIPVIRKSLRIFVVAIAFLYIADNILDQDIGTILAAAGIGGLAFALAAQDTIANLFGSVSIFADRPFRVGDRIRVGGFDGPVEDVGFRSTRIRTLDGHLVTVPNSKVVNDMVENISKRPSIKRVLNIGVTYETNADKIEKAIDIVKKILADVKQINHDPNAPPRIYFTEFNDCSLNILVLYWFTPPDYWNFLEVNEKINLDIMRAFEAEKIEFAFPTQTLYVKKD